MITKKRAKTYKGRIRIVCEGDTCPEKVGKDVIASCADCPSARVEIIGLKDEVKYKIETKKPPEAVKEVKKVKGELKNGL